MRRKRVSKIPKESKKLKYLYFIIVMYDKKPILKFGISNNYRRRFREYNNSNTIGYYLETLCIFKSPYPKRLESMLKWYMGNIDKPIFKFEYFDMKYYGMLLHQLYIFSDLFEIPLEKIV